MAFLTCFLGQSQTFDAVAYARSMTEDDGTVAVIPDSRYRWYIEAVAEDFSRHMPVDVALGNTANATSPFNTVANQQRYVLNVANGFTNPPLYITTVQTSTTGLNATNDTAYFYLNPYAAAQGYLGPAALDSPGGRVIRNEYLGELDWYGRTYYDLVRDSATGLPALDFFPIPQAAQPIYIRYQAQHIDTGTLGVASKYLTIPEEHKRNFADLLWAIVLHEETERLLKRGNVKAGMIESTSSPALLRSFAQDIRARVYNELGGSSPVALAG